MKFIIDSIFNHAQNILISAQRSNQQKLILTLPEYKEEMFVRLFKKIEDYVGLQPDLGLILKIAANVQVTWSLENKAIAENRGWFDKIGNLTAYRNSEAEAGKTLLIMLAGTDKVDDHASLADFFSYSPQTIWQNVLDKSFVSWIVAKAKENGVELSAEERRQIATLCELLYHNFTDLVGLSSWLEKLDLSTCASGREMFKSMLSSLKEFNLPVFGSFSERDTEKLRRYFFDASRFFKYTYFLEKKNKKDTLKTIEEIRKVCDTDQEPDFTQNLQLLGEYGRFDSFLYDLELYVREGDAAQREKLLGSDFVILADKVLKFKKIKEKAESNSPQKLYGLPIEVFLTSLWNSLSFYCKKKNINNLEQILLTGIEFKSETDSADKEEQNDLGKDNLKGLIGGIDNYFKESFALKADDEVDFHSELLNKDIIYSYAKNTRPFFLFSVSLKFKEDDRNYVKRFKWELPSYDQSCLSYDLLKLAYYQVEKASGHYILPVFHMQYYDEFMQAVTPEECELIFLHDLRDNSGDKSTTTNLLDTVTNNSSDPLYAPICSLSSCYKKFLQQAYENGVYSALLGPDELGIKLRKSYTECFDAISELEELDESVYSTFLQKAFLIVPKSKDINYWATESFQESGVVTLLHPALLEMIQHQTAFLCECFCFAFNSALSASPSKERYTTSIWEYYRDIAQMKSPVMALLADESKTITSRVRGNGLFFRIGERNNHTITLSSRSALSTYVNDEVSDSALFKKNSQSLLLKNILIDYVEMHPHAWDGISIGIYKNDDIQSVISGINHFLEELSKKTNVAKDKGYGTVLDENRKNKFLLDIKLFSESSNDAELLNLLDHWKDIWQESGDSNSYKHYRKVQISLSQKLIHIDSQSIAFKQAVSNYADCDITIFYDFIHAFKSVNDFKKGGDFDANVHTSLFPILEKKLPTDGQLKRTHILSNRQFPTSSSFERYLKQLKTGEYSKNILLSRTGDYQIWVDVFNEAHECSNWVVAIDPSIDKQLLAKTVKQGCNREIIGFGSGVGRHGEANYTISSQMASFSTIKPSLICGIKELFKVKSYWADLACEKVACKALQIGQGLSGLSLVRVTGVGDEYIRDFLSYTFSKAFLAKDQDVFDTLISLDAYRHWFKTSNQLLRPDLLRLQVQVDESGILDIRLTVIECKLSEDGNLHQEEAISQVTSGIQSLKPLFVPLSEHDVYDSQPRPDRRFWWMQLHRLVASQVQGISVKKTFNKALERLAEGQFSIEWSASIFLFDQNKSNELEEFSVDFKHTDDFDKTVDFDCLDELISVKKFGGQYILREFLGEFESEDTLFLSKDSFESEESHEEEEKSETTASFFSPSVADDYDYIGQLRVAEQVPLQPDNIKELDEMSESSCVEENIIPIAKVPLEDVRVLLGTDIGGNPIYWEYGNSKLTNRHMMIFGSSGQGKTYAIQCILAELAAQRHGNLVVDYTNGFLPDQLEDAADSVLGAVQHVVQQNPLPINPFLPQKQNMGGIFIEDKPIDIGGRIASVFNSVYNIGDQQSSVLNSLVRQGVETYGSAMNLDKLLNMLDDQADELGSSAKTLRSKIEPFVLRKPFLSGSESLDWQSIFDDQEHLCNIFQLAGMDMDIQKLIIEFTLWNLWSYLLIAGNKKLPRTIVLDEVQNLDHREGRPLSKYLREGRKFGASLIMATQTMSNLKKDERDQLFNVAHMLFFRPGTTELQDFAKIAHQVSPASGGVKEWQEKLSGLSMGECYSIGGVLDSQGNLKNVAKKIKISALEDRAFHG